MNISQSSRRTPMNAKLALVKGQWCMTKVEYVGLTVGPNGIEPQASRIWAIQDIIMCPMNVSEGFVTDPASSLKTMRRWSDPSQNSYIKTHLSLGENPKSILSSS
ncbi:hypothetical protein ATANTOWER_019311 [Ataeniobius toweri]|uniref:Uncharacterized protein n=1 Tax=Ataeniobius toweri TaxID=208326 RepID=A0ABU7AGI3_9TELE|nr:hypothetical protein [Ataeniobius toweri]